MSKARKAAPESGYFCIKTPANSLSIVRASFSSRRRPTAWVASWSMEVTPKSLEAEALRTEVACGRCLPNLSRCIRSFTARETSSWLAASAMSHGTSPFRLRAQTSEPTRSSWLITGHFGRTEQAVCRAFQPLASLKLACAPAYSSSRTRWSSRARTASWRHLIRYVSPEGPCSRSVGVGSGGRRISTSPLAPRRQFVKAKCTATHHSCAGAVPASRGSRASAPRCQGPFPVPSS
mmetsp:Transcript_56401/g.160660  ORF Transcript_56401/g.160660 Transcript_56401/m.160660 type:complete len:235 (+) Transcript_56401:339-1043(+)